MFQQPYEYPDCIHVKLYNDMRNCRFIALIRDPDHLDEFSSCLVQVRLLGERQPEWDEFHTVKIVTISQMDRQAIFRSWKLQRAKDRLEAKQNPILSALMNHTHLEELHLG